MGDFVKLLDGHLTRRQVRVYIQHMVDQISLLQVVKVMAHITK